MPWNIYFFETRRGEKIVKEFIKGLQESTVAKISQNIDLLKLHGPFLGMPYSKRLTREISELRIRGKEEVRILYSFSDQKIYMLHAFKKKSQKLPMKELKIAEARQKVID